MSLYGQEYLKHQLLKSEIEKIEDLFYNADFSNVVRTKICQTSNRIIAELPDKIDKIYYVLNYIAKEDDAWIELDGTKNIWYDFRQIDKLILLSHALGDKIAYYKTALRYPLLWEHLVSNSRIHAVANSLKGLFEKYGKSPTVFYATPIVELRKYVNDFRKQQQLKIDEIYRHCLQDGRVDVRWTSEYNLYRLILQLFPNAIFQYSPSWLAPQSLDIYIDEINTAIEYQGQQHYGPLDIFGGIESYQKTISRDAKKKNLCNSNGVKLLYWKYDIPITKENVFKFLCNHQ